MIIIAQNENPALVAALIAAVKAHSPEGRDSIRVIEHEPAATPITLKPKAEVKTKAPRTVLRFETGTARCARLLKQHIAGITNAAVKPFTLKQSELAAKFECHDLTVGRAISELISKRRLKYVGRLNNGRKNAGFPKLYVAVTR